VNEAPKKVLIVDDAGPVIVLCVNVLQSLGYSAKGVNRGEAALELLRKEPFDLMIVDYKMPGMNGLQVWEQARTIRDGMAFVLVTGHATPQIIDEANRLGCQSILLKPFTSAQLRGAVEKALVGGGQ
jgi:two-component system response regulator (stage 0 sporulation protein F)